MNLYKFFYLFLINNSKFRLPSITEVFPEIKKIFIKKYKHPCKNDNDCIFPYKCCDNPLDLLNKQCCTGLGAYIKYNHDENHHFVIG